MDSLFHFLFPMMAVLAARVHLRHGLLTILPLGLIAVLIDADHFIGTAGMLHNIFFTLVIPLVIIVLAFRYGNHYQREFSILLLIFLFSHTVADLFMEGQVALLYPLTDATFSLAGFTVAIGSFTLVSSTSIGFAIYFLMLLGIFFLEEMERFLDRTHRNVRRAFSMALRRDRSLLLDSI
jgi:hypothetical protein